jgi:hypothetical protein
VAAVDGPGALEGFVSETVTVLQAVRVSSPHSDRKIESFMSLHPRFVDSGASLLYLRRGNLALRSGIGMKRTHAEGIRHGREFADC